MWSKNLEDTNKKDAATVCMRNNNGLHPGARDGEEERMRDF